MMTRYEEEFYHNIRRLTNCVEEIAEKLDKNSEMDLGQAFKVCSDNDIICLKSDYYHKVIDPSLNMLNFLKEKLNEDSKEPHRTVVTIKLGFDNIEEYKRFEEWLKNGK